MKHNNDGFSLLEITVAIAILGMFFATACSSLMLGFRMNEHTNTLLQDQLAVSSAVETLMAEGITENRRYYDDYAMLDDNGDPLLDDNGNPVVVNRFPNVSVLVEEQTDGDVHLPYYKVTVSSNTRLDISVTTFIREEVAS